MDLRELYYLNALAEEQSISKAAERLYIAQASLSQFLRQFEAQLGSPIFVRTNKGIRPTPSGKVFLSHAKHILKEYQQAQQEFWDNENTVGGTVFFGVSSFRGSYVIPPILKKFYDQNPRATINIYEGNSMNLVEKIREGELDLALSAYPIVSTEGIQMEYLYRDEVLLVATKDHPILRQARMDETGRLRVSMEEVTRHECILSGKDTMLGHLIEARQHHRRICRIHGTGWPCSGFHLPLLHRRRAGCRLSLAGIAGALPPAGPALPHHRLPLQGDAGPDQAAPRRAEWQKRR